MAGGVTPSSRSRMTPPPVAVVTPSTMMPNKSRSFSMATPAPEMAKATTPTASVQNRRLDKISMFLHLPSQAGFLHPAPALGRLSPCLAGFFPCQKGAGPSARPLFGPFSGYDVVLVRPRAFSACAGRRKSARFGAPSASCGQARLSRQALPSPFPCHSRHRRRFRRRLFLQALQRRFSYRPCLTRSLSSARLASLKRSSVPTRYPVMRRMRSKPRGPSSSWRPHLGQVSPMMPL